LEANAVAAPDDGVAVVADAIALVAIPETAMVLVLPLPTGGKAETVLELTTAV
jgi:hypothetical protein